MSLRLNIVRNLDVTVVELIGRVTLGEGSVAFRSAVRNAVWNGHRKFALDYGDISYQDSSGNGEIVAAYTLVANSGGELVLFDLTKRIHDLLQITKLYTVFSVYDSREAALAHFDSTRNPEIKVTTNRHLHVAVIGIEGALTEKFGASQVPASVTKALNAGIESVILLCPQVLDIDRAGGDCLLQAGREVCARGGELVLAGVEQRLLPAITAAGIQDAMPLYETVDAALGRFGLVVDKSRYKIEVVRAR